MLWDHRLSQFWPEKRHLVYKNSQRLWYPKVLHTNRLSWTGIDLAWTIQQLDRSGTATDGVNTDKPQLHKIYFISTDVIKEENWITLVIITGSTRPRSVTSPVMAVSERTQRSANSDTRTVAIATPADGPSLLMAPAGKWMCTSVSFSKSRSTSMPSWKCTHTQTTCHQDFCFSHIHRGSVRYFSHICDVANLHWVLLQLQLWSNGENFLVFTIN